MVVAVLAATALDARAETQELQVTPGRESTQAQPARFAAALAPLALDGRLDELSWSAAPALTRFFEIYPANVAQPPAKTEARFLYDATHIYIGVRAFDPQPLAIRAPLAKRDQVGDEQDYAEIVIDTTNSRRSALVFRTNARGVVSDAQFSEATQAQSYAPDFDFDVRTSVDDSGWTAEFRIPFSTLRYEAGEDRSWAFMIVRGFPRDESVRISSAPVPRGANCQLCFAAHVEGIIVPAAPVPLSVTPQVTYSRNAIETTGPSEVTERASSGLDVKWQPRPNSVVDFTANPDFSHVEADALQLTANARFALFLPEKRPFFQEGVDLLSTPIPTVHTRTLTDPDLGVRITHRGEAHDVAALAVRDAGGGSVIEPGSTESRIGLQDWSSTVLVGRYRLSAAETVLGVLGSARLNDDGSNNLVAGIDATWSASPSDRLVAQVLWSQARNPDRPDLLPLWSGQELAGTATMLRWEHTQEAYYATVSHERSSQEFRAWNGFVPQVGISRLAGDAGLNFYPRAAWLLRVGPFVQFAHVEEAGGELINRNLSIAFGLDAPHSTFVTFGWQRDLELTTSVLETLDSTFMTISTNPVAWMPTLALDVILGDGIDLTSGEVGQQFTSSTNLGLRLLDRLDFDASIARHELDSRRGSTRLLTDTAAQATVTWYVSSRLYAQLLHQQSKTERRSLSDAASSEEHSTGRFSSLVLSYQSNWRTRFFIGLSHGLSEANDSVSRVRQTEAFVKFTYALSLEGARRPLPLASRSAAR